MTAIEQYTINPTQPNALPPVLLVHGAWHGAWCWHEFAHLLADRGYTVHYFSLPGHGRSVLAKPSLNHYSLSDYVQFLTARIDELEQPPVVIAHSMGGALLQLYLQQQHLPAAVAMASIPHIGTLPLLWRIFLKFPLTFFHALFRYKSEIIVAHPERARALFFSKQNPIDYHATHKLLGPESMRILIPLMFRWTFRKIRTGTPILVIAGEKDATVPVSMQHSLAAHLRATLKIYPEQGHCLMLEPMKMSIANDIDDWIRKQVSCQSANSIGMS